MPATKLASLAVIDPEQFGVSFSVKQCRNFGIDSVKTLDWLIREAGFRRFRLMSYWDEHEKSPGTYDFKALDQQIKQIARAGGVITLALGARQPRWPENHWPDWAWAASKADRTASLLHFIEVVVQRYKHEPAIISYQLENEALLKSFGRRPEVDRPRLRDEFNLVKRLDPSRPIIMSTSTSWGIPARRPLPDIIGFSYYHIYWNGKDKRYHKAGGHYSLLHRLRARLGLWQLGRPSFIHELQAEPWGPTGIWKMPVNEQNKSMSPAQLARSISLAQATGLTPIDLWGGEWWYWRTVTKKDAAFWQQLAPLLKS